MQVGHANIGSLPAASPTTKTWSPYVTGSPPTLRLAVTQRRGYYITEMCDWYCKEDVHLN